MYNYDRSYKTARAVYFWLELVGWATVVVGVLAALFGLFSGGLLGMMNDGRNLPFLIRLIAMLPGLGMVIGGLFVVAYVQTSRSHVDTAEATREMLEIARKGATLPTSSGVEKLAANASHPGLFAEFPSEKEVFSPSPVSVNKTNQSFIN